MARLDWDKARRNEAAKPERDEHPVVGYWVIPSTGMPCHHCRERIPKDFYVAYRHQPRRFLCQACVETLGVSAQPSKRWLAKMKQDAAGRRPRKGKQKSGRRARRSAKGSSG